MPKPSRGRREREAGEPAVREEGRLRRCERVGSNTPASRGWEAGREETKSQGKEMAEACSAGEGETCVVWRDQSRAWRQSPWPTNHQCHSTTLQWLQQHSTLRTASRLRFQPASGGVCTPPLLICLPSAGSVRTPSHHPHPFSPGSMRNPSLLPPTPLTWQYAHGGGEGLLAVKCEGEREVAGQ